MYFKAFGLTRANLWSGKWELYPIEARQGEEKGGLTNRGRVGKISGIWELGLLVQAEVEGETGEKGNTSSWGLRKIQASVLVDCEGASAVIPLPFPSPPSPECTGLPCWGDWAVNTGTWGLGSGKWCSAQWLPLGCPDHWTVEHKHLSYGKLCLEKFRFQSR